jgi:hypothetical protein
MLITDKRSSLFCRIDEVKMFCLTTLTVELLGAEETLRRFQDQRDGRVLRRHAAGRTTVREPGAT